MLIDTHCHIDQFSSPESVVAECEASGVKVIAVTNLPCHYEAALPHLANSKHVFPALGFHPLCVSGNSDELRVFEKHANETRYIGEIGLDFSKAGLPSRNQQEEVFSLILTALGESHPFATLHSRGAESEVLDGLRYNRIRRVCFHWYSGGIRVLEDLLADGHFVSINPSMLRSQKGKKMLEVVPLKHLLAESDGPYAKLSRKACSPSDVGVVYQAIADKHQITLDEVEHILEDNFKRACN